jgi:tRNA threonylcarbamoyl adenosine modification protein (Sua5/YciO/YrdC/YwlC family)
MAQYFQVIASHPQRRLIVRAAQIVRDGGVIAYPTDSCYALGCHIGDKDAMLRLRRIRRFDERHHLSLVCRDLSDIGVYAKVDNAQYRLLRALTPGSYTFILRGTREVPRRLLHPKRKTIGVRLPDHPVAQALLAELGEPLLSTTAQLPGDGAPLDGGVRIRERLEHDVDLVLDAGSCGTEPTTIIDLTGGEPVVVRRGKGSLAKVGSDAPSLIKSAV